MKKNIEKFLGKFDEQDKGVPFILTTPSMIEGHVTLGYTRMRWEWVKLIIYAAVVK